MNRFFGTFRIVLFAVAIFASMPFFASAADFSVTPLIIDLKANPRDILKETIGVMNNSTHVGNIYAFVNNTDPLLGTEEWKSPANTDVSDSLANWIEIKRGSLDLPPNEKVELPLLVQVNLHAKPGIYHATITFSEGGTRAEAEANIKSGISVSVNLEVADDAKEVLELSKFVSNGTFISGKDATFSYDIKNVGNRPIAPKGEVRIFNRNGAEVATLNVNEKGEVLDPNGGTSQLASVWKSGSRFGRYKAMLNVEYGSKQRGTLQDTVFFWLIPWKEILAIFLCLLVVLLSFVMYWHNSYSLRGRQVLAHATVREFAHDAPKVQNQVYSPVPRSVSLARPRIVREREPVSRPMPAQPAQGGAVRIQPKPQNNQNAAPSYIVSLKK